jgi:hypothetical protein
LEQACAIEYGSVTPLALAEELGQTDVVNLFLDLGDETDLTQASSLMSMIVASDSESSFHGRDGERLATRFDQLTFADMGISSEGIERPGISEQEFTGHLKRIQRKLRWWLYNRHMAAEKMQAAARGMLVRKNLKRLRSSALTIQSTYRQMLARRQFKKLKKVTVSMQTKYRERKQSQQGGVGAGTIFPLPLVAANSPSSSSSSSSFTAAAAAAHDDAMLGGMLLDSPLLDPTGATSAAAVYESGEVFRSPIQDISEDAMFKM